jgi:hypothetical protein
MTNPELRDMQRFTRQSADEWVEHATTDRVSQHTSSDPMAEAILAAIYGLTVATLEVARRLPPPIDE